MSCRKFSNSGYFIVTAERSSRISHNIFESYIGKYHLQLRIAVQAFSLFNTIWLLTMSTVTNYFVLFAAGSGGHSCGVQEIPPLKDSYLGDRRWVERWISCCARDGWIWGPLFWNGWRWARAHVQGLNWKQAPTSMELAFEEFRQRLRKRLSSSTWWEPGRSLSHLVSSPACPCNELGNFSYKASIQEGATFL